KRAIFVIVHDQYRRIYPVHKEQGRVFDIITGFVSKRSANAGLGLVILEHHTHDGAPTDIAICRGHDYLKGYGSCCLKHVGLRNQISYLIASPTLTLYRHVVLIHKTFSHYRLNTWNNTVEGARSGQP